MSWLFNHSDIWDGPMGKMIFHNLKNRIPIFIQIIIFNYYYYIQIIIFKLLYSLFIFKYSNIRSQKWKYPFQNPASFKCRTERLFSLSDYSSLNILGHKYPASLRTKRSVSVSYTVVRPRRINHLDSSSHLHGVPLYLPVYLFIYLYLLGPTPRSFSRCSPVKSSRVIER